MDMFKNNMALTEAAKTYWDSNDEVKQQMEDEKVEQVKAFFQLLTIAPPPEQELRNQFKKTMEILKKEKLGD